jgi:DNA-binding NtrC family response regulator
MRQSEGMMAVSKKILFIDDQLEDWQNFLSNGLEEFGFELIGLDDPANALSLIASLRPDAVLLDILFPGGKFLGKPTLEKIKKKYPNLPVMMITSTMDKTEYSPEDYELADYRYAKAALADGDCTDLAGQLERIITAAAMKQNQSTDAGDLEKYGFIVGATPAMQNVLQAMKMVADQDHTVLITGESGTGKGVVASALHRMSNRHQGPFITIVCASLPGELLESELFGHEKGAFTGAIARKAGKFETAGEGTIFLDEIGEIALDTQVKLLRFLQDREFERVGGNSVITSKARIIAATNRDLNTLVKEGKFREDIYYRLSVVPIRLPPLRERKQDIKAFMDLFIAKANKLSNKKNLPILREDVLELLGKYPWPGNIRELEHMVYQAVALADGNILQVNDFPSLCAKNRGASPLSRDIDSFVDNIFQGAMDWEDLKREFGAQGETRRDILLQTINRWQEKHKKRPSTRELSGLLHVSEGNMRRILSEYSIKLTRFGDI